MLVGMMPHMHWQVVLVLQRLLRRRRRSEFKPYPLIKTEQVLATDDIPFIQRPPHTKHRRPSAAHNLGYLTTRYETGFLWIGAPINGPQDPSTQPWLHGASQEWCWPSGKGGGGALTQGPPGVVPVGVSIPLLPLLVVPFSLY